MVQGLFLHVKFKANIHISLPSLIRVQTGQKTCLFLLSMFNCFLVKWLISQKAYCWCIIKEFLHLHNAILSK